MLTRIAVYHIQSVFGKLPKFEDINGQLERVYIGPKPHSAPKVLTAAGRFYDATLLVLKVPSHRKTQQMLRNVRHFDTLLFGGNLRYCYSFFSSDHWVISQLRICRPPSSLRSGHLVTKDAKCAET